MRYYVAYYAKICGKRCEMTALQTDDHAEAMDCLNGLEGADGLYLFDRATGVEFSLHKAVKL